LAKLLRVTHRLYELLSCRATNDFVVGTVGGGCVEALVTDHYPTARREAAVHAAVLSKKGLHVDPPADYHELGREGRYAWVHSDRSHGQLAVARLFRHEALDYKREPFRVISVVSPKLGTPILFVAVGESAKGSHHISLLREVDSSLKFRPYSLLDIRGWLEGAQKFGMKRFAEPVVHPILTPIVDVPAEVSLGFKAA
jgi:hypothetical protein